MPHGESEAKKPVLSLVLGSRNDAYMGNSRWRLETTLNYVANNADALGRRDDVEVIVTDWGSEVPLSEAIHLGPAASRVVSFLAVPPALARERQKDAPFAEVVAVNAGARRARGQYIGRIDQDTLVGKRFLTRFFEFHEGRRPLEVPLPSALLFANQRMVPYRFAVRCPSLPAVDRFINWFGRRLTIEVAPGHPFYAHGVGLWLIHRNLWMECGGYDERMIYANNQEINMIARLMERYRIVDLGKLVEYDFYHLEHYHALEPRIASQYLKVNPIAFCTPDSLHPNGDHWGLAGLPLDQRHGHTPGNPDARPHPRLAWAAFMGLVCLVGVQIAGDRLVVMGRAAYARWARRGRLAWRAVRGQFFLRWPFLLIRLWVERPSARARRPERPRSD